MTSWEAEVEALRDEFVERMRRRGFVFDKRETAATGFPTLAGGITVSGDVIDVEIRLPVEWPYRPPRVVPTRGARSMSWHQEPDGALCLFPENADLPWVDADVLLEKIHDWFVSDASGWTNDTPDLDLERYLKGTASPLVVYGNLQTLVGRSVRLARVGNRWEIRLGSSKSRGARLKPRTGFVYDVGELETPIRNWQDVAERLDEGVAEWFSEQLAANGTLHLVLAYTRSGNSGALVLRASITADGEITLTPFESASGDEQTLRLRAGRDADALAECTVGVVGAGAIGSFTADLLARAGIGKLVLCDGETLRPGNCIRHLAGLAHVGKPKTVAVRDSIRGLGHEPHGGIELKERLRRPADAAALCEGVDFIVDATGSAAATSMLVLTADHTNTPLVSAYLHRDGGVGRVDRWPRGAQEVEVAAVPPAPGAAPPPLREGGCGDPLFQAPAHAAMAAAAQATAVCIDALRGRPTPASIVNVLVPQPDAPYDSRTVIT